MYTIIKEREGLRPQTILLDLEDQAKEEGFFEFMCKFLEENKEEIEDKFYER